MPDGFDPARRPSAPGSGSRRGPAAPSAPSASDDDDAPVGRWRRDWERMKGWPDGVPITAGLQRRLAFELQRTSVREDLQARLRRADMMPPAAAGMLWVLVFAVVPQTHMLLPIIGVNAATMGIWIVGLLALEWWAFTRMIGRLHGPSLRAGLRREGVDCCVRCAHLMGGGGPAGTCPECGLDHEPLPLGWGPGPIGTQAATRPARPARTVDGVAAAPPGTPRR